MTDEFAQEANERDANEDSCEQDGAKGVNTAAQKTPISLLQELCAQSGVSAEYKLMSAEGAAHAPTFMYRVQVGDISATATGPSKKKSKHAVAKSMLEMLLTEKGGFPNGFMSDGVHITIESLKQFEGETLVVVADTKESKQDNPVGALQEYCMECKWQPPFYETQSETGLPHEREFVISCCVENFTEIGTGKSKRLAKRKAAAVMYEKLKSLESKKTGAASDKDAKEKMGDLNVNDSNKKNKNNKPQSVESLYSDKVKKFLEDLKTSTQTCLQELQEVNLTKEELNCIEILSNIGTEQNFKINYIPIAERGKSGDYHCLVQIDSLPIAVCFGSGTTPDGAKSNCARNALNFIQLMTKK